MACILTAGLTVSCDNPDIGGLKSPTVWLINLEDISSITYDGTDANVITGITLKSGGKQAYKFEGLGVSTAPAYRQVTGRGFGPTYEHELGMQIFSLDHTGKDRLPELALGKSLAIVETNNDDQAFEVYGTTIGMSAVSQEHIKNDAANGGTISVVLKTPEEGPAERKAPNDFFSTDRATTLALIAGYETPTA